MSVEKCTQDAIKRAVQLKKGGAANRDIAAALCVSEGQFSRWVNNPKTNNQAQLAQELKKAEADYKNALLNIIAKASTDKDWKAAAWLLERKYPSEYSRMERVQTASVESAPELPAFYFSRDEVKR